MTKFYYYLTVILGIMANVLSRIDMLIQNKYYTTKDKAKASVVVSIEKVVADTDTLLIASREMREQEVDAAWERYCKLTRSIEQAAKDDVTRLTAMRTSKLTQLNDIGVKLEQR